MVNQVPVVAVLMIVQGSLECLMGILLLILGPVMLAAPQHNGPSPAGVGTFIFIFGVVIIIIAGLKIAAGVKGLKYRDRAFGIVTLLLGVVTFLTFYCAPTSLALMIYGLIVYLNQDVAKAFELGEQGYSPRDIQASFGQPFHQAGYSSPPVSGSGPGFPPSYGSTAFGTHAGSTSPMPGYGVPSRSGAAPNSGSPGKGMAVASLILGLIGLFTAGLFLVGAITGLILGIVSLTKSRKSAVYAGSSRGMAIAGIVLNSLAGLIAPLIAAIAIPNLLAARRAANTASAIQTLRTIHSAQITYQAAEGKGNFATNLSDLAQAGYIDNSIAQAQSTPKNGYRLSEIITTPATMKAAATYWLTSSPIVTEGATRTGNDCLYLDETGIIRHSKSPKIKPGATSEPISKLEPTSLPSHLIREKETIQSAHSQLHAGGSIHAQSANRTWTRPFAGDHKTGPVIRMPKPPALEHFKLNLAECFGPALPGFESGVIIHHQLSGSQIRHRSQTQHLCLTPSQDHCPAQTIDALAGFDLANPGIAGGEHHQLGAT